LGEVKAIADRVVTLRDGKNAGGLAREEISHDRMVSLMVGRDIERFYAQHETKAKPNFLKVERLKTPRYPTKSVSFSVAAGEILGFAGLVGSGRTEVAQAIFGVEPALEGTISLEGDGKLTIRTPRAAIDHGIYLVPEDRRLSGLILDWPIRDNISLPALERYSTGGPLGLVDRGREQETAEAEAKSLSIKAPSVETRAGNLSGGNQQKVVLGKWLSLGPKVMIFDEPTRGIDVGAKAEIYRLMRALADKGVAVMMISSDMEEVLNVSDRIAVMCEGEITGVLSHDEASEEAIMKLAVAHSTEH
jgi:ribose transport system ATP-binding protein